jgi:hypothetical protein
MKYCIPLLLFFACSTNQRERGGADNALDAGRNYLQARLQGDFETAARYCEQDSAVLQNLRLDEAMFRALDREGRQLHRTASIQVYALEETGGLQAKLIYALSYESEKKDTLYLVQKNQRWFIASPQLNR